MKRTATMCVLLAALGGCMSSEGSRSEDVAPWRSARGGQPMVPGVQGSWGQPVPMIGPYNAAPPGGATLARQMMSNSVPLDLVQTNGSGALENPQLAQASGYMDADGGSGLMQAGAMSMPGAPGGMMQAGAMAMPGAPGGMMQAGCCGPKPMMGPCLPPPSYSPVPGAVAAVGTPMPAGPAAAKRTSVRFASPAGMKVAWYGNGPTGPGFAGNQIEVPGRYNFLQGAIYRLKLSDIPNRPGVDLYPTLEVVPSNLKTDGFIAHSAVPVFFTEDDFDQVANGNYLVKVIYLPYPYNADVATTGPDEIVSSRLEPGVDPVQEALKRGSILLIARLGNIDLEAPNTPPMDSPPGGMAGGPMMGPVMAGPGMPGPMMPGMAGMPGPMMPGMPGMPGMAHGPTMPMPGFGLPPGVSPPGVPPLPPPMPMMAGPNGGGAPMMGQPMMGAPMMGAPVVPPANPLPQGPAKPVTVPTNTTPTAPATGPVGQAPGAGSVQPAAFNNKTPTPATLAGQNP